MGTHGRRKPRKEVPQTFGERPYLRHKTFLTDQFFSQHYFLTAANIFPNCCTSNDSLSQPEAELCRLWRYGYLVVQDHVGRDSAHDGD